MHPTEAAFIADILAHPEDDTPRVIYADWLDDQQSEPSPRAEFIRVQCELAGHGEIGDTPVKGAQMLSQLIRRERELLSCSNDEGQENWMIWRNPCRAGYCLNLYTGNPLATSVAITFTRGFVSAVRCTLADWIGTRCHACLEPNEDVPHPMCRLCHGTGRVNAHGRAIVQCQPVSVVEVGDRIPYMTFERLYGWSRLDQSRDFGARAYLPPEVYDLLPESDHIKPPVGLWETEERARLALSTALLRWAGSPSQQ